MPQLDQFTYFTQFFWLCLFFFTFYIIFRIIEEKICPFWLSYRESKRGRQIARLFLVFRWILLSLLILRLGFTLFVNLSTLFSFLLVSLANFYWVWSDLLLVPLILFPEENHLMMRPPTPEASVDLGLRLGPPGSSSAAGVQPNPAPDLQIGQPGVLTRGGLTPIEKQILSNMERSLVGKDCDPSILAETARAVVEKKEQIIEQMAVLDPSGFWINCKEELITSTIYPSSGGEHTLPTLTRYLNQLHGPGAKTTGIYKKLHQLRINREVFGFQRLVWYSS